MDRERCATSFAVTRGLHRAAVELHQAAHDREAKSETTRFASHRVVSLPEGLEDERERLRRMPCPVSRTVTLTCEPARSWSTSMVPAVGENFTALLNKLERTCSSRSGSPRTIAAHSSALTQRDAPCLGGRADDFGRCPDHRAKIDWSHVEA